MKAATATPLDAPARSASIATKAPRANGPRKKPVVRISPTAATTPAMSHNTQASTMPSSVAARWAANAGRSGRHERPGEIVGVERAQVLERLADADELDRDAELTGDGQRDAALGRAVELREDDAVDRDRLGEELGLPQAVLARGRVDAQEGLVRGVGHLLLDDAADLGQLRHQVVLGVQTPGRVDDDHVD